MSDVAVIVPTLRRPESLERALRSLFLQSGVADRVASIVVADNDPLGSAESLVEALRGSSPWPLIYRHAPTPGVATARNAARAAKDWLKSDSIRAELDAMGIALNDSKDEAGNPSSTREVKR